MTAYCPTSAPVRFQLIRHGSTRAWCFELVFPEGAIELDYRGTGSREEVAIHHARALLEQKFGAHIAKIAEFDIVWCQTLIK